MSSFDFARFLTEQFGSPRKLTAFLKAYGCEPPSEEAVGKWFSRGTVPAPWLPLLVAYLEIENGEGPRLALYLTGPP